MEIILNAGFGKYRHDTSIVATQLDKCFDGQRTVRHTERSSRRTARPREAARRAGPSATADTHFARHTTVCLHTSRN